MDGARGPIQPGEVVLKQLDNPETCGELMELLYWADRRLLLAQKVL